MAEVKVEKTKLITEMENYVIKTMQNSGEATPQEIAILPQMIAMLLKEENQ